MNAAIYYHPDGYSTKGPKLMGRQAAGESFLRGYFLHSTADRFLTFVEEADHAQEFEQWAQAHRRDEPVTVMGRRNMQDLQQAGVLYLAAPSLDQWAYLRSAYGHGAWSLCGVTHTICSARVMDALAAIVTAPVQPWDAVICTSTVAKSNVERVLQSQVDFLAERLDIRKIVLPHLPVIPLGIHVQDFDFSAQEKADARVALGLDAQTLVVLYMGRLSFHAKAHPLAMYHALESAVQSTGQSVVLLECGQYANDSIANAFQQAAQYACPSVKVIHVDGRDKASCTKAWACADIFCSLSDNIQETFGLTPVEAMAAGLPVVVSAWNGYNDTVRHEVDGFCIPTCMPQAGLGEDLALRHALEIDNYDEYCGNVCSFVSVDVAQAAHAFTQLLQSAQLRQRMGEAGRERARTVYDWRVIIPQYESLWEHLTQIRHAHAHTKKSLPHCWPARLDPFYAFSTYPTHILTHDTVLSLVDDDVEQALIHMEASIQLGMVNYAAAVLPKKSEIRTVLHNAAQGPATAQTLVENIPQHRKAGVMRSLVWLVKLNVLKI